MKKKNQHWHHKFKSKLQKLQPSCDLVFPDEWREALEGERKESQTDKNTHLHFLRFLAPAFHSIFSPNLGGIMSANTDKCYIQAVTPPIIPSDIQRALNQRKKRHHDSYDVGLCSSMHFQKKMCLKIHHDSKQRIKPCSS